MPRTTTIGRDSGARVGCLQAGRRGTPVAARSSASSAPVGVVAGQHSLDARPGTDHVARPGPAGGERLLHRIRHPVDGRSHLLRAGNAAAVALDVTGIQLPVRGRERGQGLLQRRFGVLPEGGVGLRGLDQAHANAPGAQLHPEAVGHALERELGGVVGARHRRGHAAAEAGDEDHAAPRLPQLGQHGLRHGHLADQVHLHLAAQLVQREALDRPAHHDARVVHHGVQLGRQGPG